MGPSIVAPVHGSSSYGRVGAPASTAVSGRRPYAAGGNWRDGHRDAGHWGGGYWRGRYWPAVDYYGVGFAWFLPVLPAFCATYWFDSVPYYYVDDAYYTWDPSAAGYVLTEPPPVAVAASNSGADTASATADANDDVYAYPMTGQSDEQQASDRRECEQWANSQTGQAAAGSTAAQAGGSASTANADNYRRAMIACLDGRGYSAK